MSAADIHNLAALIGPHGSIDSQAMLDPAPSFVEVPLDDLRESSISPQRWYWHEYMPAGHVTLLAGHGGVGKSTFALMLAASIAVGTEFLGVLTTKARVAYFSAEDSGDVVRARLARVCAALGFAHDAVRSSLTVLDATDGDPVLFTQLQRERAATTPAFERLAGDLSGRGVEVVVIDNASEVFAASEIDRTQVAGFVRSLRKLGRAVLLVSHVDKASARNQGGSQSYSGSTAWHNSARSRLLLVEAKLPGTLELRHEKSNLGRLRDPLLLKRVGAGLMALAPDQVDAAVAGVERSDADKTMALLRLIHEAASRGEYAACSHVSTTNPARLFSKEPTYPPGLRAMGVVELLRNAQRDGLVIREGYKDAGRKDRERWAVTPKGVEHIGAAPSAPSAPSTDKEELGAVSAGNTGAAAPSAPSTRGGYGGRARAQHGAKKAKKTAANKAPATRSGAPSSNATAKAPTPVGAFVIPAGLLARTAAPAIASKKLEPA
jgi:putative DNA primase/helicase